MHVKFSKLERVAGLFVMSTIVGGVAMLIGVAIKQGWFEPKVKFKTTLRNAEGLHIGTHVQIAGLRTGSVQSVELRANNEVHVTFEISEKYQELVRQDSVVRTVRPFVISEKVLDIGIGSSRVPKAREGDQLLSEPSADIMDLISGRTLAPHLDTMSKMMDNLRIVAEAILDPSRSQNIIKIFDELQPLVKNMNSMSREVTSVLRETNKDKKLVQVVDQLVVTTREVNQMLPELNKLMPDLMKVAPIMAKESPKLAADMAKIASNLAVLTDEMSQTLPAIKSTLVELGPEIPRATRRAMEALDETVVTLKALQKSFILRSNAREVREEEAERERKRLPTSSEKTETEAK